MQYKPISLHVWFLARNDDNKVLDIRCLENAYGYVTIWWDASTLTNGHYRLRAVTECTASIHEMPEGIHSVQSMVVPGVIDWNPPRQLGFPEPADGIYDLGNKMGFEFDEAIQCSLPLRFTVQLKIEGVDRVFDMTNMVVVCEGRTVQLSLRRGFSWESVNGRKARLELYCVEDLHGNEVEQVLVHEFTFANLNLDASVVMVSGVFFNSTYIIEYSITTSNTFKNLDSNIESQIAAMVGISIERIHVTVISSENLRIHERGVLVDIHLIPAKITFQNLWWGWGVYRKAL